MHGSVHGWCMTRCKNAWVVHDKVQKCMGGGGGGDVRCGVGKYISFFILINGKQKQLQSGIRKTTFKNFIPGRIITRHISYPRSNFRKWKQEMIKVVSTFSDHRLKESTKN